MTRSIDADGAPDVTEPPTHERAREARAHRPILEDAASGGEYVDDRLRLDE